MTPELRELLILIKDCQSQDEACLMLRACGVQLNENGAVDLSLETFLQPLREEVCVYHQSGRYVRYADLPRFVRDL